MSHAESRPADPAPRPRTGRLRMLFWLVLLAAAMGLWFADETCPPVRAKLVACRETIGTWLVSLEGLFARDMQEEIEAEQQAFAALTQRGALVIAEPGSRAVSSVSFPSQENHRVVHLDDDMLLLLRPLYRLSSINLAGTDLADEQLQHLQGLSHLASLVLSDTPVTDAGLVHLRGLRRLEVIHLRNTAVADEGLAHLAALPELKILDLSNSRITDEGLKHLSGLKKLSWLLIQDDPITDAGLDYLHEMKNLKELTLSGTKVTADGVAALQEAVPGLAVDR